MSKLCSNTANCGIKKIQNALPESLKTKVVQSLNISTYVFVMKNIEQAKKLLKFLEDKGFSNISIDSKGTTITAQSSSGLMNSSNNSGSLGCKAKVKGKACGNYSAGQSICSNYYVTGRSCLTPKCSQFVTTCTQCKWYDGADQQCKNGGCYQCPK